MKKFTILFLAFFLFSILAAFSQRPTIQLIFTAEYNNLNVPLDSIYIQNLTQPGDTMLYAPDTVLLLDYISGIPDYPGTAKSSFSVSPNYPNPSVDGKTSIDVFIPERENVTMRIVDLLGREVTIYENKLDAGTHHFTFVAGKERYYVLSVNFGNENRSIKMVNSGNGNQTTGTLNYQGMTETEHPLKSQEAIAGFDFSLGDQLRFIGYAKSPSGFAGSDVIEAIPAGNENYVFEILEGLPCPGIPTVTYQGQTYKTVHIGAQCWFKENLNVGVRIDGAGNQTNNSVAEKYCYNDDPANCDVYGGLYQWDELMQYTTTSGAQGLCPEGWHITTNDEWTALTTFLGGEEFAGGKMKETGTIHWNSPNEGATNESGFTGLPGGLRMTVPAFSGIGNSGTWWSSTEQSSTFVYDRGLSAIGSYVLVGTFIKPMGLSVRCVNDETFLSIPSVNTAEITEIGQTTATGGGQVTDDGGANLTARGVCWSTSQNPTIADNHTEDGTGTGAFVSNITGLTPNTAYFVRVYATNSVGTAYGNEVNFTTLSAGFTCGSSLTINHVTGEVAPVDKTTTYGTATNIPGEPSKCWITSNLGADHQATAKNDATEASAGWYWQFNRKQGYKHDGTTRTPNTPWITNINENSDWLATNDPCALELGDGWRIPSGTEWINVHASGNWTDWNGPWNSVLKMHAAGYIAYQDGSLQERGISGSYWSSTQKPTENNRGNAILFTSTWCYLLEEYKAGGFTLRCLNEQSTSTIPTVTTSSISGITQISALGGGEVTNIGGFPVTARGVCWSTSQNPTIADSTTVDGSGLGSFESILTYLSPNTLYYVRAYATNNLGTAYGEELDFTTLPGSFTCGDVVSYEGQEYNTLQLGTQCWFRENLNVGTMVTQTQTNNGVVEKYCYNDDPANCEIYGGLYDWGEAMQYSTQPGIQAICPAGWHIPTDEEFTIFTDYISSQPEYLCDNNSINNAKAIATNTGWDTSSEYCAVGNDQSANNASGFSGMPVGMRMHNGTGFSGVGNTTAWYSSTESTAGTSYSRMIASDFWYIMPANMSKNYGLSVRCLKNETSATIPTVTTSGITGITQTTATSGGEVSNDGGAEVTARGVCWSTSTNPTIADSYTEDGTGTGVFVSNITSLTPNTPYFARAYATNSVGTAYGNEVNFTTLSGSFTCGNSITINHVTGDVAPVNKTVTYGTVTNIPGETSKCWITSNLGSDHQATAKSDATEASAGWYWQFNRKQGYKHTGTVRTPNTTWITSIDEDSDWQASNDPCALELGVGWRIPTNIEWTNVDATGNWTNWNGPWNSDLKMHAAGQLSFFDGSLGSRGSLGNYWTNTQINNNGSRYLVFTSSDCNVSGTTKSDGLTLRCLKDAPACGSSLTINHITGEVAPVNKTVTYGTVTNIPGEPSKCWITSNLGADHQATAVSDATEPSAGWYWQFNIKQGYKHDGTTRTPNTLWLSSISENSDWTTANDPCAIELGNGWRVPTYMEWFNVDAGGNWLFWNGPWESDLKMHAAGYLNNGDGSLTYRGADGSYWSSSQTDATRTWVFSFYAGYCGRGINLKAYGFPLRCIRE